MSQIREVLEPFVRQDPKLVVELDSAEQAIVRMQGRLSEPVAELARQPLLAARAIVAANRALLGGIDEKTALADGRVSTDAQGMTHVVLEQIHGDARVIGAQVSVHFKADGTLNMLGSSLVRNIDAPTTARISAAEAQGIALADAGIPAVVVETPAPALVVASAEYLKLRESHKKFHLCWRVNIDQPQTKKPAAWIYFVDAVEGKVLFRYSGLIATGVGVYSAHGPLPTEPSGVDFSAIDSQTSAAWTTHPRVLTRDWNDQQTARDDNDHWGEPEPAEAHERHEVDIHRYLGYVLSYFHLTHGYDGWNGAGADTIAYAHFSDPDNAYWHSLSNTIRIGCGDLEGGSGLYGPFTALDVLFHEFTHGVNDHFQVVQTYQDETGALNEAIADAFAAFGTMSHPADDPNPWALMNLVVRPSPPAPLQAVHPRSLADPSRDANGIVRYDATSETSKFNSVLRGFYPDHYTIRYLGASDFGGVHCNAPIIGHAIYLMVAGGVHRLSAVSVTGIGQSPVEQMLFYVVSTPGLLTNASTFADFRRAMLSACQMMFPENVDYLVTVKNAFKAVGVGPDLYLRDYVGDTGREPAASLSCMSPDIIPRTTLADAPLLAQMADLTNASMGQDLEKGQDNYVYVRLLNGGSTGAGGTFRLYLSPVSTFPNPASWTLVGSWPFGTIAAGGFRTPASANECLVVPAALTNTLGAIHCCFIGVIESLDDPAPDRMLIDSMGEFHAFIQKSNNFAWRNVNIVNAVADPVHPVLVHGAFAINGFGRRPFSADFEIDTRNVPREAVLDVVVPKKHGGYLRFAEVRELVPAPDRGAIGALPREIAPTRQRVIARAAADLTLPVEQVMFTREMLEKLDLVNMRALRVTGRRVTRVTGLRLRGEEAVTLNFVLKLPPGEVARDVFLAFRQVWAGDAIGQMNYQIRLRPKR